MEFSSPKIRKNSYISGGDFPIQKKKKKKPTLKKCLIFWEMEFSGPKLKKLFTSFLKKIFLIFQEGTCKKKKNFLILLDVLYFSKKSSDEDNC